jgi:epothilone polyketide synthase D
VSSKEELLVQKLREAATALARAKAERDVHREPIAVVGLGCRFPGGIVDAASFWRVLEDEVDAIAEVPPERWNRDEWYDPDSDARGKMNTRWGGFLPDLERFDPTFFGISPREASSIDPQLRLLLECSWEALEDAGIPGDSLMGSATGVFMGVCGTEYQLRAMLDVEATTGYGLLGSAHSTMIGRLSYWLGLKGPSVALDTACSSSLVAVHLACQALRQGECGLALAGGANVLLDPAATVLFSRLHAMSPSGRCRAFSADADGYVRSEGAGVIVLERLSDALRHGRRILGVVRGSAINQDGRSNGPTAPSGPAQEAVIREALRRASVEASTIDYLECHGTGTPLGDPIEIQAAAAVLGAGRAPNAPLVVGSVKTNIGHSEGAAGVASLIKAILALGRGQIPRSLHFAAPNPHIAWSELPIEVAASPRAWPASERPRRAAVSSFGISGTNAHVVLEQAPPSPAASVAGGRSAELVVLSARSAPALQDAARRLGQHLQAVPEMTPARLAPALALRRTHHEHRLAIAVGSRDDLLQGLSLAAHGELPAGGGLGSGLPITEAKIVFVCPGQGSQWPGMARDLMREEPAFREALGACDRAIADEVGWSLLKLLERGDEARLGAIDIVQPALFAISVALAAQWRAWGVEPDAVIGHSMGEVAAACIAGALSLADGAGVICRRSGLLRRIAGHGAMAVVELPLAEAEAALRGHEHALSVAVANATRSTVLSGAPAALDEVLAGLERRGVFCRRVKVDVASHSPQVDPLLDELATALAPLRGTSGSVPMRSTVTGAPIDGRQLDAGYWVQNLRQPVRFAEVVSALLADGHQLFVELSPHPILVSAIEELRREGGLPGKAVGSLRRERPGRAALLEGLGGLYAGGFDPAWDRIFPGGAAAIDLPHYPWQRSRHWHERSAGPAGHATGHPLLGTRLRLAGSEVVYQTQLVLAEQPWLGEHRVDGRAVMAGVAVAELLRAAGEDAEGGGAVELRRLLLEAPLVLDDVQPTRLQVVVQSGRRVALHSLGAEGWRLHASAELEPPGAAAWAGDPAAPRRGCDASLDAETVYRLLAERGLEYGPSWRAVSGLERGPGQAVATLRLPEAAAALTPEPYHLHPVLLDSALQAATAALGLDGAYLPFEIARVSIHRGGARSATAIIRWSAAERAGLAPVVDIGLIDGDGAAIATLGGVLARRRDHVVRRPVFRTGGLYQVVWRPQAAGPTAPLAGRRCMILGAGRSGADERAIAEALVAAGASCTLQPASSPVPDDVDHLVRLWPAGGEVTELAAEGLAALQALAGRALPVLWVTSGAVAIAQGEVPDLAAAALWGLARTARQEDALELSLLDVARWSDAPADDLLNETTADGAEALTHGVGQAGVRA